MPFDTTKNAAWARYEEYSQTERDSTGEKTHKGRATLSRVRTVAGKCQTVEEEIDAHLTTTGEEYKPL
jgi:hypothetical protein